VRVLVGCEFSGIVRDKFIERGHDAVSCDLLASERPGPHIIGNVFDYLDDGWDLMIFFWPCTNMAVSGARWFHAKREAQARDIDAFKQLATYPGIPKIAGENPIGVLSSKFRKPDQIIQPWQFGHGEVKATCLWLKNLPLLKPTKVVDGRHARVHREPPSPDRWKNRSRTFVGIADAMAQQWG
jgi:hypothetical protein